MHKNTTTTIVENKGIDTITTGSISVSKKAQYILKHTNDGNNLAPKHLKLVEMGVNSDLNEKGLDALDELYRNVSAGYVKPWFYGVKHLTKDHKGYVYWRGGRIEHYSYDSAEEEFKNALKLGEQCRELERWGYPVTLNNCMALHDGKKPKRTIKLSEDIKKTYYRLKFWYRYEKRYQLGRIKSVLKIGDKE